MGRFIRINDRIIGEGRSTYIIAEIGSNHDGDLNRAKELIRGARYAGADAVKFQSFTAEGLINPLKLNGSGKWEYNPAYQMIERLSLPAEWHPKLKEYAESLGLDFLSAPFDSQRAELLHRIGVPAFKIASGDITNEPLLKQVGAYKKPVILSTGASYLSEVERAVEILKGSGCEDIAILHCNSLYPPCVDEINLRALRTLKDTFNCPVGFSDHTHGSTIAIGAVAMGASIIEKHITLSRNLVGPDHCFAMEVEEFKGLVDEIRKLESSLGDGIKRPSRSELSERIGARRSIYAKVDIRRETIITEDMLKLVRHAYGLEPKDLPIVLGKKALRDINKDMPVEQEDVCR